MGHINLTLPAANATECTWRCTWFDDLGHRLDNSVRLQLYLAYNVILLTCGICGNVLILYATKVNKKLHNLGSVFVCNMAVSDLGVLFLADGFTLIGIVTDGMVLLENRWLCVTSSYLCLAACFCTFWNIAGASIIMYLRICHRLLYHKYAKIGKVALTVAAVWIWSGLLLLPSVLGFGSHRYDPKLMYCVFNHSYYLPYTAALVTLGALVPLALTTLAYAAIGHTVFTSRRAVLQRCAKGISDAKKLRSLWPWWARNPSDVRLLRSLSIVAIYICITWIFLMVIWLRGHLGPWPSTEVPAMLLAHSHCVINAVLYIVSNRSIREGLNICCAPPDKMVQTD